MKAFGYDRKIFQKFFLRETQIFKFLQPSLLLKIIRIETQSRGIPFHMAAKKNAKKRKNNKEKNVRKFHIRSRFNDTRSFPFKIRIDEPNALATAE